MNAFEAAIEAGDVHLGEITKPMLTPQKWAAFLLCDEHTDDAYLFARQQIANRETCRICAVYDMQVALLKTEAFQHTMATQRRYRSVNSFVCSILHYAGLMILSGKATLPDDNQFVTSPRPVSFNRYGTFNWKGDEE